MNWKEFKDTLQQHPELELHFQYAGDMRVHPSYHITEIKQAPVISVDCGGIMNNWTEVIIQLYEPDGQDTDRAMTAQKALGIIDLVETKLPLKADAIVKIEFGNTAFDTRQMLPQSINIRNGELLIDLRPDTVQCKANERGGSCGPARSKVQLINLTQAAASCTPGGGCC